MTHHRIIALLFAAGLASAVASAPAAAQVAVVGGSIQEKEAAAGSRYEGSIILRNGGSLPERVRVYLTDYRFEASGTSDFAEAGSTTRSNARWIRFGAQEITVAPRQSATVTYTVEVPQLPAGAPGGSYWSMAMIEAEPPQGATRAQHGGVKIQTVVRQGIQLVTHVGSTAAASVAFSKVRLVPDSSGMALEFDAENDGSRARRLALSVDIYSESGVFMGRYSKPRGLVYPDCSIRQTFSLGNIPRGDYLAFIVADAGDDDLFAGNFKVKF